MSKQVYFTTERKKKDTGKMKFYLLFFAAVLLVLALSCVYVLAKNDFDFMTAIGGEVQTTEPEAEETPEAVTQEVKRYLLWGCNSNKDELKFLYAVKAEFPSGKITICSLSPYLTATYHGSTYSLSNIFASYGEKIMYEVASDTLGIQLDGYVGSTSETFKQMINYFGSMSISVEEKVEYKGEFSLILMDGNIGMKGDALYRYIVYQGTLGDKGLQERAQILSEIFTAVLTPKQLDRTDKIFAKIANSLMTNISIVDFSTAEANIENLLTNGAEEYILTTSIKKIK